MTERVVHQFPPGEYTRVHLVHDAQAGDDHQRSLAYRLTNRGFGNGGVVLVRMTGADLEHLANAISQELGLP